MMVDNQNGAAAAAAQAVVPEMPASCKNKIEEMGEGQIMNDFLEAEEEELLVDRNQPMHNVRLIHPCVSKVTNVTLKKWHMTNACKYNLRGSWHEQVVGDAENALQDGTMVQLYAFRRLQDTNNELCFALVNLDLLN
ncbi:hypothetical protein WN944_019683 [Citrus x changshan-huyou]|uniref:TF-B3 domain-containing protein n=1 Tax=Citrus x changshan-huyou TaxID=2935761 RepID=A0AAP0QE84_9ROSI